MKSIVLKSRFFCIEIVTVWFYCFIISEKVSNCFWEERVYFRKKCLTVSGNVFISEKSVLSVSGNVFISEKKCLTVSGNVFISEKKCLYCFWERVYFRKKCLTVSGNVFISEKSV